MDHKWYEKNERRHQQQTMENMCSHRHHHPTNLSAHGEAQMMEVRVRRIPSISCLSSSISFQFSLKRCMKHAATTRLALFFDQQVRFMFFLVVSFPRWLLVRSVFLVQV